jgi:MazG family protein
MAALRTPETGCPWDLQQTFATIAPYTIEEAYEVADVIARADMGNLKDELGDLLFNVVYHARLAEEAGLFTFADIADAAAGKMIRRHPHVFAASAEARLRFANDPKAAWAEVKAAEAPKPDATARENSPPSAMDAVPSAGPAFALAFKTLQHGQATGYAWRSLSDLKDKIDEELAEFYQELGVEGREAEEIEEFGDVILTLVSAAVIRRFDPDAALRAATAKYQRRFRAMEQLASERGVDMKTAGREELRALWREAKTVAGPA